MDQQTRQPKNPAEGKFFEEANAKGWTVSKRGWPDFFCVKDGNIILVEVKKHRGRNLKRSQLTVLRSLARYGVPCYRWSPDIGFEPISPYRNDPFEV